MDCLCHQTHLGWWRTLNKHTPQGNSVSGSKTSTMDCIKIGMLPAYYCEIRSKIFGMTKSINNRST